MRIDYVVKRIGFFLLITWLAATLNFFIPRLSGQNPVRERLLEQALLGGYVHAGCAGYRVRRAQREDRVAAVRSGLHPPAGTD